MKNLQNVFALMLLISSLSVLQACDDNDGPLEKAGEAIDDAADDAGDAVEDAADNVGDAVEEACEDATDSNCD